LSRHGVPGWETGTKKISQPGQIKISVVVAGAGSAGSGHERSSRAGFGENGGNEKSAHAGMRLKRD